MTPERDEPLPDEEPLPVVTDANPSGEDGDDDSLAGLDGPHDLIAMGLYPPWPTAAEEEAEAKRPFIDVDRGLAEMAAATWRAIGAANDPPRLYRHGSALAWIADAPARIQLLNPTLMRHHLAQIARFRSWERHGKRTRPLPPDALVADLLAVPHPALPVLTRLVRTPVFAATGELVADNGYHRASGVYLAKPASLQIPPIADHPSAAMIKEARALLVTDWLGDFPFVSAADRAHALALLLTPLVRECIDGGVPLFVVSKPTPGSGATLLVRSTSLILDGAAIAAGTFSGNGDEMRKRITAVLLRAPSMVLFDNVPGHLVSAPLSVALTTTEWGDRLLRESRDITLPQRSTFVVTGNNPTVNTELARRTVLIRLDAQVDEPWTRTEFRHADLEGWVTHQRGRLLWAALTLVRAWQAAGSPRAEHAAFGSFEPWADLMAGVLAVAEMPGLLGNRDELFATADEERAQLHAFLAAWWDASGEARVTVATLRDARRRIPSPGEYG